MGVYMMWTLLALAALVGLALLLFLPGVWVLALVAAAIAIVYGVVWAVGRGVRDVASGEPTPDVEERRDEHVRRRGRGPA